MILNCKFDKKDDFKLKEESKTIDFTDYKTFGYTFWNNVNKLPNWYSLQAIDLLYISLATFAADRLFLRSDAKDGWCRDIEIYLPILNYDKFIEAKPILEKMLNFLSGDKWTFYFRKRKFTPIETAQFIRWKKDKTSAKDYDYVCMFSGGLDSFIGAIDLLEKSMSKVLFISHYGGGKGTKEFQDLLKKELIDNFSLEKRDFNQFFAKVPSGIEESTRTRSFMFFTHAIVMASCFNKNIKLVIPENGFISLNIPMTYSRIGSSSTRTTHPQYMKLLQKLICILDLSVTLVNPYQYKTKGEMISKCANQTFLKQNLNKTMSCSHPDIGRMLGEKKAKHCGYCLPCVIRQAAIKRAKVEDNCVYRNSNFSGEGVAKINLNSYRLGLEKFDSKYAYLTIQMNGLIENNFKEHTELYIRGMNEIKVYLEGI